MSRKDRVEHFEFIGESLPQAMRDELATLIAREVKDPRVSAAGVVGVARVECTPDFSVAKVYVSIFADDSVAASTVTVTSVPSKGKTRAEALTDLCPARP